MINCKIISVNIDNVKLNDPVRSFGHVVNNNGDKIRYIERRREIDDFLDNNKNNYFKFDYLDAITPNDFKFEDDFEKQTSKAIFNNKEFFVEKDIFYIANILSHYEIWSINDDTLVLEDDVDLSEELSESLFNVISNFKNDDVSNSGILYLQLSTPWLTNLDDKSFKFDREFGNFGLLSISNDFSGTAAYFITDKCKKNIINHISLNKENLCACDKFLNNLFKKNVIKYFAPFNKEDMIRLNKKNCIL
jgi:GR25 family glycosyltransferase involved in LPS biosynthesis